MGGGNVGGGEGERYGNKVAQRRRGDEETARDGKQSRLSQSQTPRDFHRRCDTAGLGRHPGKVECQRQAPIPPPGSPPYGATAPVAATRWRSLRHLCRRRRGGRRPPPASLLPLSTRAGCAATASTLVAGGSGGGAHSGWGGWGQGNCRYPTMAVVPLVAFIPPPSHSGARAGGRAAGERKPAMGNNWHPCRRLPMTAPPSTTRWGDRPPLHTRPGGATEWGGWRGRSRRGASVASTSMPVAMGTPDGHFRLGIVSRV